MKDFDVFLRNILTDKKRILILSIGGGNDYIGAYSIAKWISKLYPGIDLILASSIEIKGEYKPLTKINDHLFTIEGFLPEFDFEIKNHSIRLIAQGIKNETMNLPYFVAINNDKPEKIKLAYQELFDKVMLITPNIPEAEILTKTRIRNKEDMIYAANKLLDYGAKNVLVKGGHLPSKIVQDIFVNKFEIKIFNSQRFKTKNTHGTGCTLSSAITTFLSCGKPLKKSCELGIKYVSLAIKTNPNYGKGHGPINHLNSMIVNKRFR